MNVYIPLSKIKMSNICINFINSTKNTSNVKYKINYFSDKNTFNGIYVSFIHNMSDINKIINIEDYILKLIKDKISKTPVKNLYHFFKRIKNLNHFYTKIYSIWETDNEYGLNYKFYPSVE